MSSPQNLSTPLQGPVVIGADHAGFAMKEGLKAHLASLDIPVVDVGCPDENRVDYPNVAQDAMDALGQGKAKWAILCCGSGIGMAMTANRFPHARAVVANDIYTAEMSRRHNNANVFCIGGRFVALPLACTILDTFMNTPFEGGRHQERLALFGEEAATQCSPSIPPTSCSL